jgi:hypothetical protein
MEPEVDFAWVSLLQRRADYARKSAESARTPEIANEFEQLAALYLALMNGEVPGNAKAIARGEPKSGLIQYLQTRGHQLLMDARSIADKKRADDIRYLAGVYGAEASRLKNSGGL